MSTAPARPLQGVLFVIAAVALFACFDAGVKVASGIASVGLVIWARYCFQVGITALTVLPRRGTALLRTGRPTLQVARGLSLLSLSVLAFFSLKVMPVGEFTAIVMLTPLLITLLATLMLGERVPPLRWLLLAGGMAGALIVIRPKGGHGFHLEMLLPFGLVLTNAAFQIITSRLARTEDPTTTHFYTGLVGATLTTVLLPWSWQQLSPAGWALMVLLGVLSSSGHFLLILGYMRAKASTLTPFLYFQIVFATLVGWIWFGHAPDGMTLLGIGVIAGCGVAGTWLGNREQRQPALPGAADAPPRACAGKPAADAAALPAPAGSACAARP